MHEITWIPIIEYALVAVVAGLVTLALRLARRHDEERSPERVPADVP